MREYLFRGKRIDNDKWAYGYYVVLGNYSFIINPKNPASNMRVIPESIGQFTGLFAKSGKKVFEHDIVEFGGGHGYPKWKPKQVVWGNTLDKALSTCCGFMLDGTQMFLSTNDRNSIKILGNIHDNPELLDNKKPDEEPVKYDFYLICYPYRGNENNYKVAVERFEHPHFEHDTLVKKYGNWMKYGPYERKSIAVKAAKKTRDKIKELHGKRPFFNGRPE
jgi:hypothetical protein